MLSRLLAGQSLARQVPLQWRLHPRCSKCSPLRSKGCSLFKNLNRKWVPFFVHYSDTRAQQREADGGEVEASCLVHAAAAAGASTNYNNNTHQAHQHELKFRQSSLQH